MDGTVVQAVDGPVMSGLVGKWVDLRGTLEVKVTTLANGDGYERGKEPTTADKIHIDSCSRASPAGLHTMERLWCKVLRFHNVAFECDEIVTAPGIPGR